MPGEGRALAAPVFHLSGPGTGEGGRTGPEGYPAAYLGERATPPARPVAAGESCTNTRGSTPTGPVPGTGAQSTAALLSGRARSGRAELG
jgi:hypothetical protein